MEDLICLSGIEQLEKRFFYAENIFVVRAFVTPPAQYIRKRGSLKKSRFFYIVKGKMVLTVSDGTVITAAESDIIYLPNDVEYISVWESGIGGEYITFECNLFFGNGMEFLLNNRPFIIMRDIGGKYYHTFLKLFEIFSMSVSPFDMRLASRIYILFLDLVEDTKKSKLKNSPETSDIYKGIVYIVDHYREKVSIEELAKICNVSQSTFTRKFNQYFHMSPHKYQRQLKMQKAMEMMNSESYNATEIAIFLGYTDLPHFTKTLKKYKEELLS